MIRSLLLAILLFSASLVQAQGIGEVKFGSSRQVAAMAIEAMFGEPTHSSEDVMSFRDKMFEGYKWDQVDFKFTDGKLTEARFYMDQKSKSLARRKQYSISRTLAKNHALSEDIEEDGSRFYAGGKSPIYYGHLFTLFISPRNGEWSNQLRFGPFKFN